ncbi:two-component system OmpR family response regulator [Pseudoduganella lurida]|uniref:Two-component system OmpR family response regulator n=1 Tax=Pseudoduganella lurida TaxID=1036180 RepID=A0A562RL23_9BURK|nr:response regulator [Pseudoduganella lurida]TWI69748.1 two-component system OmpR family response regulator [Pseudoduganella lurida]
MSQRHILLVDDEPHVLRVLRLALEREGYSVTTASDGHAALACMAERLPDVLISDIQMDGMTGRELCPAARRTYPDHPFLILVMTSMTALDERNWARELPNTEFLEKPLSPRQLVARLSRHFAALALAPAPAPADQPEPRHVA